MSAQRNEDGLVLFKLVGMGFVFLIGVGCLAVAAIAVLIGHTPNTNSEEATTHPLVVLLGWILLIGIMGICAHTMGGPMPHFTPIGR